MTDAAATEVKDTAHEVGHSGPRKLIGRVRSDKMDKTVVVEVVRFQMDALYKKYVRVRKRYKAHDEKNQYLRGDRVEIVEHRPLSKHKKYKVLRLIERSALQE